MALFTIYSLGGHSDMMTLSQMATFITNKVGQFDANSIALCKTFVNMRYQMVYDSESWIDSLDKATVSVSGGLSALDSYGMNRVVSVLYGGLSGVPPVTLEPIDLNTLLQTDPTLLTSTGVPRYYQLQKVAGVTTLREFPSPAANHTLFVVYKRNLIPLADGDISVIRNSDTCLISYAMGDMLERQRQYAKAQAKFQEANSQLTALQALEKTRSNLQRTAKNITVSGNTLAEMTDSVCARCGMWGADVYALVAEFMRRNYQRVYDMALWQESLTIVEASRAAGVAVLPEYIGTILAIRFDGAYGALDVTDQSLYFRISPLVFEQSGTPVAFSILTPVAVRILPVATELLTFTSSSASDTSSVFISGESAGAVVSEKIALNGTTPQPTVNQYDVPLIISKQPTAGTITINGQTSGTVFQTLGASERERKHLRIQFQPTPDINTVGNCMVLGKRKLHPLVDNGDSPILSNVTNILIDMTTSDLLTQKGDMPGAAAADKRAQADLLDLISLETKQGANSQVVVPYIEPSFYNSAWNNDQWFLMGY